MDPTTVEALHAEVRGAAPFAELSRETFEGVLDMLSGRYPSDEFAELKPRITWDRDSGGLTARAGSRTLAVVSGGTIPDRGLYGVFLRGEPGATARRVGELDEEMVFESRVGDVFLLGASSWRIEEITPDRVIVSPAPGQPGKMPFWRGDAAGRPAEFGRAIGRLTRELAAATPAAARRKLTREHFLDDRATEDLLDYVQAQRAATGEVPSDEAIVVERWRDDVGDWRVCVLSPFGARVHAPWVTAALARMREASGEQVEGLWADDGLVFRFPDAEAAPDMSALLLTPEVIEDLVVQYFPLMVREHANDMMWVVV
jgi:ATP-dependent Lhr-like helicase